MTTTKVITLYNFDELSESAQDKVVENMWEINVHHDWHHEFRFSEEVDNLALDYRKDMLETYRVMLNKEYDYLTSREAVIDTILANEYNFTEDGSRTVTL